jgi:hypothetical protein
MKSRIAALSVVVVLALAYSLAQAKDEQPVTLQGDLQCAKCSLKEASKCSDVLVVKEGDKQVEYHVVFTDGSKEHHVCMGKKLVKLTGSLSEKNGQKTIAATKVEEIKAQ